MEVIGLIATVPELVKLIKTTTRLVREITNSRKALAKTTKGLDAQLDALAEALTRIEVKRDSKLVSSDQLKRLAPLFQQLRDQLNGVNNILASITRANGSLKRAKMIVGGVEKKLREQVQGLETSKSLLILHLAECSLTLNEGLRSVFDIFSQARC